MCLMTPFWGFGMCISPIQVKGKFVPCGHCIECRMMYSSTWAYRIALESTLYEHNTFITLTYNEDNLPEGGFLSKRDLQLFIKRLRKHFKNDKIRYFACGEYGSKGRPHYHVILFNVYFDDLYYWCMDNKKNKLFRSPTLERLWSINIGTNKKPIYKSIGFSSVAELTIDSAKYCAKYLQKVPKDGRPKPFTLMSKKPGIGIGAFKEKWLETDKIYFQGKSVRIPRYFIDKSEDRSAVEELKAKRKKNDVLNQYIFDTECGRAVDFDLYYKYLEGRISKLEQNFKLSDVVDFDGKKAELKEKLKKRKEILKIPLDEGRKQ